jgi:hypothetical protein
MAAQPRLQQTPHGGRAGQSLAGNCAYARVKPAFAQDMYVMLVPAQQHHASYTCGTCSAVTEGPFKLQAWMKAPAVAGNDCISGSGGRGRWSEEQGQCIWVRTVSRAW